MLLFGRFEVPTTGLNRIVFGSRRPMGNLWPAERDLFVRLDMKKLAKLVEGPASRREARRAARRLVRRTAKKVVREK
jgi:hypothetical protein